jgi:two-component system, chemotaxis family, protein-glutamate methylesterase/glutaminase
LGDKKIRTLLIDDSGFMRILISDLLREDGMIDVMATASNGFDGVLKARQLKPDVIITNMVMPQYDGLYVVQTLMKEMSVPIIVLSSLHRSDPKIYTALQEGAFSFLGKPAKIEIENGYPRLRKVVHEASSRDLISEGNVLPGRKSIIGEPEAQFDIIALGVSTGGPKAIEHIVRNLPEGINVPILVAQHMPDTFIESFASRLDETSSLRVSVLQDGGEMLPNCIYFAPGTSNIRVVRNELQKPVVTFVNDTYKEFNNPSIDCLFESIATVYGPRALAVILTGMGKDGVAGLQKIKESGGVTIAQDEISSVVYGMPRAAFESGAALHKLSIQEIPDFIIRRLYTA